MLHKLKYSYLALTCRAVCFKISKVGYVMQNAVRED